MLIKLPAIGVVEFAIVPAPIVLYIGGFQAQAAEGVQLHELMSKGSEGIGIVVVFYGLL